MKEGFTEENAWPNARGQPDKMRENVLFGISPWKATHRHNDFSRVSGLHLFGPCRQFHRLDHMTIHFQQDTFPISLRPKLSWRFAAMAMNRSLLLLFNKCTALNDTPNHCSAMQCAPVSTNTNFQEQYTNTLSRRTYTLDAKQQTHAVNIA